MSDSMILRKIAVKVGVGSLNLFMVKIEFVLTVLEFLFLGEKVMVRNWGQKTD